jgi:hypothetical protein
VYPTTDRSFGIWNGQITFRHDCKCEYDCGQIHVAIVEAEERTLLESGAVSYEELSQDWKKKGTHKCCHEQAFIVQALVDNNIQPERWPKLTPVLEEINSAIGGFTMDHRDQLHPDIYMDSVKKDPPVRLVKQLLKMVA